MRSWYIAFMTNQHVNKSRADHEAHQPFRGKVAFVTGGGSGIGRVTALAFAGRGARVAVVGHLTEQVEETAALIREAGGEAIALVSDVTRAIEVEAAVAQTIEAFGRLDFAFNNAALNSR